MSKIRELKVGETLAGQSISKIARRDGSDGQPQVWRADGELKSAVAIEITLSDGSSILAHPGADVTQ